MADGDGELSEDRPPSDVVRPLPTMGSTLAALGVFLLGMAAGAPFILLQDRVPIGVWLFLVTVPGELIGLVGALKVAGWPLRRLPAQCTVPRGSAPVLVVMAFGCLLVTACLLWIGRKVMPVEGPDALMRQVGAITNPFELLLVIFTIVVQGPIAEELLVRGILLRGFAVHWGKAAGVAVSALLFAVLHLNLVQGALGIVTGTVFALTLLRTGSLGPGIFMHVIINGNAIAAVVLSGMPPPEEIAETPALVVAVVVGIVGVGLVRFGLRRLPRDPERLAALWDLPPPRTSVVAPIALVSGPS